ncbi:hypothetical protein K5I29_02190 [Flavobacterium agricola]|uniref:Uncharacterized protein n=1 Tax=Flavobacterium agricola TaxID=2870839 RepID=A0ABY6LZT3_9FLAO|nr:hypothetical protein [Flavobacterium agricola]UYW01754.1 hypothetical protein K5I29_02190 [Flavobacterium agricola]
MRENSLTIIGNIAVYFDAKKGDAGGRPVRFALLNDVKDNVVVNQMKLGSGGGTYGKNESFLSVRPNNSSNIKNTIPAYNSTDQTFWHIISAEQPHIGNRDYIQYMISLINSREVYRLTAIVNNTITATAEHPTASDALVTFFIERLTNKQ